MAGVDVAVVDHELVHPGGLDLVMRFAEAAGKSQGAEVGWIIGASSLVAELHYTSSPNFWSQAGGLGLVVMGGQKVVDCRQLGQDPIQEAVLSRSSSWRFAPENGFYLFWCDWRSIVGDSRRSNFREPVEL